MRIAVLGAVFFLAACRSDRAPSSSSAGSSAGTGTATGTGRAASLLSLRPYGLKVPKSYSASHPAPLVLALHPYGGSGATFVDAWHLDDLADAKGFVLAYPDGAIERSREHNRFWNATDACCDFYGANVDDVAYMDAILDDVAKRYAIDSKRVYVVGFSNGGFMAHRLACDRPDRIAAIVSWGGASFTDPARCAQGAPVATLEVHATNDQVVPFAGGALPFAGPRIVPSAEASAKLAAEKNGCTKLSLAPAGDPLDVDARVPGKETERARFGGCPAGADVELWRVVGGEHVPRASEAWPEEMWSFLERQHRP